MNEKDLTILTLSCDKYKSLWGIHYDFLNKMWSESCKYKRILLTDKPSDETLDGVQLSIIENESFGIRLREILTKIKTPYVLILLDDYLLTKKTNNKILLSNLKFMSVNEISYMRFHKFPKVRKRYSTGFKKISYKNRYDVNLFAAIWELSALNNFFATESDNLDAWNLEPKFTKFFMSNNLIAVEPIFKQINISDLIVKGKLRRNMNKFLLKNGYNIDWMVMSRRETVLYFFKKTASRFTPKWLRLRIKKILRSKGKVFYSE